MGTDPLGNSVIRPTASSESFDSWTTRESVTVLVSVRRHLANSLEYEARHLTAPNTERAGARARDEDAPAKRHQIS